MILNNRRIIIREIVDDIGISFGSCQAILADVLGMKLAAAKNVSKLLNCTMLVREFLAQNKTVNMPQPAYSPDLAPVDFFLFLKLKTPMKGKLFSTIEEIKESPVGDTK